MATLLLGTLTPVALLGDAGFAFHMLRIAVAYAFAMGAFIALGQVHLPRRPRLIVWAFVATLSSAPSIVAAFQEGARETSPQRYFTPQDYLVQAALALILLTAYLALWSRARSIQAAVNDEMGPKWTGLELTAAVVLVAGVLLIPFSFISQTSWALVEVQVIDRAPELIFLIATSGALAGLTIVGVEKLHQRLAQPVRTGGHAGAFPRQWSANRTANTISATALIISVATYASAVSVPALESQGRTADYLQFLLSGDAFTANVASELAAPNTPAADLALLLGRSMRALEDDGALESVTPGIAAPLHYWSNDFKICLQAHRIMPFECASLTDVTWGSDGAISSFRLDGVPLSSLLEPRYSAGGDSLSFVDSEGNEFGSAYIQDTRNLGGLEPGRREGNFVPFIEQDLVLIELEPSEGLALSVDAVYFGGHDPKLIREAWHYASSWDGTSATLALLLPWDAPTFVVCFSGTDALDASRTGQSCESFGPKSA